jgi:hypothetical protein
MHWQTQLCIDRYKQTQIYTHGRRYDCKDRHTDTDKHKYTQTCTERLTQAQADRHRQARKKQTHRFINWQRHTARHRHTKLTQESRQIGETKLNRRAPAHWQTEAHILACSWHICMCIHACTGTETGAGNRNRQPNKLTSRYTDWLTIKCSTGL